MIKSALRDIIILITRPYLRVIQYFIISTTRPYISRELHGWDKVLRLFEYRDWLWAGATAKPIRSKLNGYVMHLNLEEWADRKTYFLGRWDDLETQLLMRELICPGDTVVDVGANRGMFALCASHLAGKDGRVICFEPNPDCLQVLCNEIEMNNIENIVTHQCALGSRNETVMLSVPTSNSGQGTLANDLYDRQVTYQVPAEVRIGDDFLNGEKPSLIKIDVEGFEYGVISGLRNTIYRHRPIIVTEVNPTFLAACCSSFEELARLMATLGYKGYKLSLQKRKSQYDLRFTDLQNENCDAVWLHLTGHKDYVERFCSEHERHHPVSLRQLQTPA